MCVCVCVCVYAYRIQGYIEASELMAAIGKDEAIADLIKEADKNGDGMIDYSEFFHLLVQTQSSKQ